MWLSTSSEFSDCITSSSLSGDFFWEFISFSSSLECIDEASPGPDSFGVSSKPSEGVCFVEEAAPETSGFFSQ